MTALQVTGESSMQASATVQPGTAEDLLFYSSPQTQSAASHSTTAHMSLEPAAAAFTNCQVQQDSTPGRQVRHHAAAADGSADVGVLISRTTAPAAELTVGQRMAQMQGSLKQPTALPAWGFTKGPAKASYPMPAAASYAKQYQRSPLTPHHAGSLPHEIQPSDTHKYQTAWLGVQQQAAAESADSPCGVHAMSLQPSGLQLLYPSQPAGLLHPTAQDVQWLPLCDHDQQQQQQGNVGLQQRQQQQSGLLEQAHQMPPGMQQQGHQLNKQQQDEKLLPPHFNLPPQMQQQSEKLLPQQQQQSEKLLPQQQQQDEKLLPQQQQQDEKLLPQQQQQDENVLPQQQQQDENLLPQQQQQDEKLLPQQQQRQQPQVLDKSVLEWCSMAEQLMPNKAAAQPRNRHDLVSVYSGASSQLQQSLVTLPAYQGEYFDRHWLSL